MVAAVVVAAAAAVVVVVVEDMVEEVAAVAALVEKVCRITTYDYVLLQYYHYRFTAIMQDHLH